MKITLEQSGGIYTLHSYRGGIIHIRPPGVATDDEERLLQLSRSCLLSAGQLIDDWAPQRLEDILAEHLQPLQELQPEVLLLGSGDKLRFPPSPQLALLVGLGIGYEVMDTAAACRTYNVLVAEGRRGVAVLFTG